jgi:hypothetical protein
MAHQNETRRAGGAAGLWLSNCAAVTDSPERNESSPIAQSKSRTLMPVEQARRELLRDFVFEAAEGANVYCRAIKNLIAADDSPGLTYAVKRFVDHARKVARGCKELLAIGAGRDAS